MCLSSQVLRSHVSADFQVATATMTTDPASLLIRTPWARPPGPLLQSGRDPVRYFPWTLARAGMAELADAADSKSADPCGHGGSTPPPGTSLKHYYNQ